MSMQNRIIRTLLLINDTSVKKYCTSPKNPLFFFFHFFFFIFTTIMCAWIGYSFLTTPIKDFKTKLLAMSQEYDLKRCLRKEADLCYFCVKTTKLEKLLIFIKI